MSKLDVIKKIDMDNGSFPYARDIGKVLAKTRMNNSHRGVIDAVIDKTFGWPDNKSEKKEKIKKRKTKEKISFAFFQEYTGTPISKLSTTIKDLTNWNVLKKTKQGRTYIYSFNQIVEEWDRRIFKKIFQKQGWGMVYQSGKFTNQETLPIREPLVYQSVNQQFTDQESIFPITSQETTGSEGLNNSLNNSLNNFKEHTFTHPSQFVQFWNEEIAQPLELRQCERLTEEDAPTLFTHIRTRLKKHPQREYWLRVKEKISKSPFLLGKLKGKTWKITIDYLVKNEENHRRILEGQHESRDAIEYFR